MTTIVFRDDIGIYTGKGSKLTKGELDTNFYELLIAVLALQEGGAFGCDSVEFSGNSITFHWSDGTTSGPFALPVATFHARGVWLNDQSLLRLDVVTVPGVGTYLVQIDHTTPPAPAEFDPTADDGSTAGDLLYLPLADAVDVTGYMLFRGEFVGSTEYAAGDVFVDPTHGLFSVNALSSASTLDPFDEDYTRLAGPLFAPFENLSATSRTLTLADVGKVFRCPNGCDVTFPDDVDFPASAEISFRQTGTNPVNFIEGSTGVVINPQREGFATSTPYQGAVVMAKFVSSTEVDLIGPYGDELSA